MYHDEKGLFTSAGGMKASPAQAARAAKIIAGAGAKYTQIAKARGVTRESVAKRANEVKAMAKAVAKGAAKEPAVDWGGHAVMATKPDRAGTVREEQRRESMIPRSSPFGKGFDQAERYAGLKSSPFESKMTVGNMKLRAESAEKVHARLTSAQKAVNARTETLRAKLMKSASARAYDPDSTTAKQFRRSLKTQEKIANARIEAESDASRVRRESKNAFKTPYNKIGPIARALKRANRPPLYD
jgi:hypothetical protein